jgi:hypothetical protein
MRSSPQVSLDNASRRYVLASHGGYSCLGFSVCLSRIHEMERQLRYPSASRVGKAVAADDAEGSHEIYGHYLDLCDRGQRMGGFPEPFYSVHTPQVVRDALTAAASSSSRVRVWYGDQATGRSWMDEFDMVGEMYWTRRGALWRQPCLNGMAVLDDCVIRLVATRTRELLYTHPKFHVPEMTLAESTCPDLPHGIFVNGANHANFKTARARERWRAFMVGERMSP